MNANRIERAGKILTFIGGILLAIVYVAAAFGITTLHPATMILTAIVVLLYAVGEVRRRTYEQGYKDGIDLVLTGVEAPVAVVMKASLEQHQRDQE